MRKFYYSAHLPILLTIIISTVFYFNFTAEDAYITYRYAENLSNTGSLVYNEGEPINAMTSPFHAMLSAALFRTTGHTVLGNKLLALLLLLCAAFLVWYRLKDHPQWQLLALILILMPPSVLLWTLGGLETPILLFLVTMTVLLMMDRRLPFNLSRLCLIFFMAGLAFLTRYDSLLFFLPVTLYLASKTRSINHIMIATAGAAVLPLSWLFVSIYYYGDLLPTSFYVKTPTGNLGGLIFNGIYIASYLFYVGLVPVAALLIMLLFSRPGTIDVVYQHFKSTWWLYLGLLLEILYGLTMATHHMMFSFRFFVPYLPSTVILMVDLLTHVSKNREVNLSTGKPAHLFTAFLLCLALFQLYQTVYTYRYSLNGISLVGEYRALGIRDYTRFLQTLRQEALDIEKHWEKIGQERDRHPRIITYAAGMLPYTYNEAYIYEKLVSYRHCHERYRQGLYADYIHIIAPRQGEINQQLPKPIDSYYLVSDYEMFFDGSMQDFLVYYNPEPEEHNLSVRIYEPCKLSENAENEQN